MPARPRSGSVWKIGQIAADQRRAVEILDLDEAEFARAGVQGAVSRKDRNGSPSAATRSASSLRALRVAASALAPGGLA